MKISGYKGIYVLTETKNGITSTLASCNSRELLEEIKVRLQREADRGKPDVSRYTGRCPGISL